jgi:serine/threonine protein phosphatase 1
MLTYAIGDVHGCLAKLVRLIDRCLQHGGGRPCRFVFVGDYIDRGPDSRGVIELLLAAQRQRPDEVVCLSGNHEAIMLEAVRTGDDGLWRMNGAAQTLASYAIERPAEMPPEHVEWVAALPLSFDDGRRYFVHAGVDPAVPLDRQTDHARLWIREPFLSSTRDYGRLIVHGHTPLATGLPDLQPNRLNIDTAAVYGGPLTAAVFSDESTEPVEFLCDRE